MQALDRLMRLPEVSAACRRSRTSIYNDVKAGRFPEPIRIGPRAIAWRQSDIQAWMSGQIPAHSPKQDKPVMGRSRPNCTTGSRARNKSRVANESVGRSILQAIIDGSQGTLTSSQRHEYITFARALRARVWGTDLYPLISSEQTGADVMSTRWVRHPENARKVLKILNAVVQVYSEMEELRLERMNDLAGEM